MPRMKRHTQSAVLEFTQTGAHMRSMRGQPGSLRAMSSLASSPAQEPGFEAGAHNDPHKESHSAHQKFSLIMIIPFHQRGSLWKPASRVLLGPQSPA